MRLLKSTLFTTFLLSSSLSSGAILIDTQPDDASLLARDQNQIQSQLMKEIHSGIYDKSGIMWPVVVKGTRGKMTLSADNFKRLSRQQQSSVVRDLVKYVGFFASSSYKATVNADTEALADQSIFKRLSTNKSLFHGTHPAEQLLSSYARKWAYKMSDSNGPNCWHTSIASIFPNWEKHRYMDPNEFACHLKNSFIQLQPKNLNELEFGDLIRLANGSSEVHGFTFLGMDRKKPTEAIVFTKNGYARGRYLFMTLTTVREIYSNTEISFFRPTRTPDDPSTHTNSECRSLESLGQPIGERNPLVMAGYRKDRGRSLTTLTFN